MNGFREWMYNRWGGPSGMRVEFIEGVETFCNWNFITRNLDVIPCPCTECRCNWPERDRNTVTMHLYRHGFQKGYEIWNRHGENYGQQGVDFYVGGSGASSEHAHEEEVAFQSDRDFIHGWFPENHQYYDDHMVEEPNDDAKAFYDMISVVDTPIYDGHDKSLLHFIVQVMRFKTKFGTTQAKVETYISDCRGMALPEHRDQIPSSYYQFKKLIMKLGLGVIKYDVCTNNCVLYYKEFADLRNCPICHEARYKNDGSRRKIEVPCKTLLYFPITPRLQRLYKSKETAEHMICHTNFQGTSDKMVHPAQGEAWKSFDRIHPSFAAESRNVRIGLCTDEFCPSDGLGTNYSCWLVFITPYNFPPHQCMREEFIFMSLMISGPKSPGNKIDVLLRPLVDELKTLWIEGAVTWDCV